MHHYFFPLDPRYLICEKNSQKGKNNILKAQKKQLVQLDVKIMFPVSEFSSTSTHFSFKTLSETL